jgi:RimJ/RimL family protein N-acetyltransferase
VSERAIEAKCLENRLIRLEPHAGAHREGQRGAALNDSDLFAYMPADLSGNQFDRWFDWTSTISDGRRELAFSVRRQSDGRLVGSTRFLNIELAHKRAEIGHTWYERSAWGSTVKPSCKYLLMEFAFEQLDLNRVELKCDARNLRSRQAILKLGATQEGTLRKHMVMFDGFVRDTIYFSVLKDEWSQVKAGLLHRLHD